MTVWTAHFPEYNELQIGQLVWVCEQERSIAFNAPTFDERNDGWDETPMTMIEGGETLIYLGEACKYCTSRMNGHDESTYIKVLASQGVRWVPTFSLRNADETMLPSFCRRVRLRK